MKISIEVKAWPVNELTVRFRCGQRNELPLICVFERIGKVLSADESRKAALWLSWADKII